MSTWRQIQSLCPQHTNNTVTMQEQNIMHIRVHCGILSVTVEPADKACHKDNTSIEHKALNKPVLAQHIHGSAGHAT